MKEDLNEEQLNSIIRIANENISKIHTVITSNKLDIKGAHTVNSLIGETWDLLNIFYATLYNNGKKCKRIAFLTKVLLSYIFITLGCCIYVFSPTIAIILILYTVYIKRKICKNQDDYINESLEYFDAQGTRIQQLLDTQEHNFERRSVLLTSDTYGDFKKISEEAKENKINNVVEPAITIIANYIDGFDINLDDINNDIKLVMKEILSKDLQLDDNPDLATLLKIAKEKTNSSIASLVRNHIE